MSVISVRAVDFALYHVADLDRALAFIETCAGSTAAISAGLALIEMLPAVPVYLLLINLQPILGRPFLRIPLLPLDEKILTRQAPAGHRH